MHVAVHVQEQGEADKARLKQQQEEEREANRKQHDKVQSERALLEAALERLEIENRERAQSIRQAEATAVMTRALSWLFKRPRNGTSFCS